MSVARSGDHRVRAFMVRLPSGAGYWTVLDEDLAVVAAADAFLRQGGVRRGVDDEGLCGGHRAVLAVVCPDGPGLAGGGSASGHVHDVAVARGPAGVRCRRVS